MSEVSTATEGISMGFVRMYEIIKEYGDRLTTVEYQFLILLKEWINLMIINKIVFTKKWVRHLNTTTLVKT